MPFTDVPIPELRVSRAQAIALAERHIVECGLARAPRLELDPAEWLWFLVPAFKCVHLHPRAWRTSRSAAGWTVTFRLLSHPPGEIWGRTVTMDRFGCKICLQPRDIRLGH